MENTLKTLRTAAGLTQSQLSDASGINKFQISRIECGNIKIQNISLGNAVALAKALGVHAEELISE